MRISTIVGTALLFFALNAHLKTQSDAKAVPIGVWGGKGIRLTVTGAGATVSYDCDAGTIVEPLLTNRSGAFLARGTHTFGRGGPRGPGAPPPRRHNASYQGVLDGDMMRLTVSLPDLGRTLGEFTLELGRRAVLERCG